MANNLSQNNLPFNVEFSAFPNSQLSCQNNLNVMPNGPILPTRPIFPSALPPSLSQYPSNMQTNFINVRREGNICNLRTSSLIVDSGVDQNTLIKFKNLPVLEQLASNKMYYNLIIDETGKLFKHSLTASKNNIFSQNFRNEDINNLNNLGVLDENDNF